MSQNIELLLKEINSTAELETSFEGDVDMSAIQDHLDIGARDGEIYYARYLKGILDGTRKPKQ